jgi:hypothetical protein
VKAAEQETAKDLAYGCRVDRGQLEELSCPSKDSIVSRISPEAPVPVFEIRSESTCLGGAANVSANVGSLGAVPIPSGWLGAISKGSGFRRSFGRSELL